MIRKNSKNGRWARQDFQRKLIDYVSSGNIDGWQWAASKGTDAVPYFTVFNPTTQSQKFDPKGKFIRKYVKELQRLSEKMFCQSEKLTKEEQQEYGVILGEYYPLPIVNHKERRKKSNFAL